MQETAIVLCYCNNSIEQAPNPHLENESGVDERLHVVNHVVDHDGDLAADVADDVDGRLLLGREGREGPAHGGHAGGEVHVGGRGRGGAAVELLHLVVQGLWGEKHGGLIEYSNVVSIKDDRIPWE